MGSADDLPETISYKDKSVKLKDSIGEINRAEFYLWCFGIDASMDPTASFATINSLDYTVVTLVRLPICAFFLFFDILILHIKTTLKI